MNKMKKIVITSQLKTKNPIPFNYYNDLYKFIIGFSNAKYRQKFHSGNISNMVLSPFDFKFDKSKCKNGTFFPKYDIFNHKILTIDKELMNIFYDNLKESIGKSFNIVNNNINLNMSFTIINVKLVDVQVDENDEYYCYSGVCESSDKTYISPAHPKYNEIIFNNLFKKYSSVKVDDSMDNEILNFKSKFRVVVTDSRKSRPNNIMMKHDSTSRTTSYIYSFKLENCPEILRKVAMACGIGNRNSSTYGFLEKI